VTDRLLSGHLREIELARELKKHPPTLKRWRDLRIGPPFITLGSEIIYPIAGTKEWLAAGGTAGVAAGKRATQRQTRGASGVSVRR
jgi:hypothetical protein